MANDEAPAITIKLRHAEAEHLLAALDALPDKQKGNITHASLHRQITIVKDYWDKLENNRKAQRKMTLQNKTRKV